MSYEMMFMLFTALAFTLNAWRLKRDFDKERKEILRKQERTQQKQTEMQERHYFEMGRRVSDLEGPTHYFLHGLTGEDLRETLPKGEDK